MSRIPLLSDSLSITEKMTLANLATHPGFPIFVRILEAACARAAQDTIKLNPDEEGYERKLKAAHSRARTINEFAGLVRDSINWNIQDGIVKTNDLKANPSKE